MHIGWDSPIHYVSLLCDCTHNHEKEAVTRKASELHPCVLLFIYIYNLASFFAPLVPETVSPLSKKSG